MLEIVRRCIGEVMRPRNSSDVVSVGVTNQRETLVAWDPQTGSPFYNAIRTSEADALQFSVHANKSHSLAGHAYG